MSDGETNPNSSSSLALNSMAGKDSRHKALLATLARVSFLRSATSVVWFLLNIMTGQLCTIFMTRDGSALALIHCPYIQ